MTNTDKIEELLEAFHEAAINCHDWDSTAPAGLNKVQQIREAKLHDAVDKAYSDIIEYVKSLQND